MIVRVVLQPGLEDLQLPRDEELALEVNGDISLNHHPSHHHHHNDAGDWVAKAGPSP